MSRALFVWKLHDVLLIIFTTRHSPFSEVVWKSFFPVLYLPELHINCDENETADAGVCTRKQPKYTKEEDNSPHPIHRNYHLLCFLSIKYGKDSQFFFFFLVHTKADRRRSRLLPLLMMITRKTEAKVHLHAYSHILPSWVQKVFGEKGW